MPQNQLLTNMYVQTDKSRIQMEWGGFQDASGVDHFEYRVIGDNNTITDWKTTGRETMTDVEGLSLHFGKVYNAELRAINSGNYSSDPVGAGVLVYKELY